MPLTRAKKGPVLKRSKPKTPKRKTNDANYETDDSSKSVILTTPKPNPKTGKQAAGTKENRKTSPQVFHIPSANLKLPKFSSQQIDFWFIQVESLFRNGNVTDDQVKFDYVIASLDPDISYDIRDVIENPPQKDKYVFLKTKLIHRLSARPETRIDRILDPTNLGDRTPSQFLRYLRSESQIRDDRILKSIWKKTLPANIRVTLAGRSADLDELADIADEIFEAENQLAAVTDRPRKLENICGKQENRSGKPENLERDDLAKTVADLVKTVQHLATTSKRAPSRERQTQSSPSGMCFFHSKFGSAARKCNKPCTFQVFPAITQGNESGQQ